MCLCRALPERQLKEMRGVLNDAHKHILPVTKALEKQASQTSQNQWPDHLDPAIPKGVPSDTAAPYLVSTLNEPKMRICPAITLQVEVPDCLSMRRDFSPSDRDNTGGIRAVARIAILS